MLLTMRAAAPRNGSGVSPASTIGPLPFPPDGGQAEPVGAGVRAAGGAAAVAAGEAGRSPRGR